MDKRKMMSIAYWVMILAVVLTCIFIYFYLSGSAKQCVADPMQFYEAKTGARCFCMKNDWFGR